MVAPNTLQKCLVEVGKGGRLWRTLTVTSVVTDGMGEQWVSSTLREALWWQGIPLVAAE